MQYTNAIVRRPGRSVRFGTSSSFAKGRPEYERAIEQHDAFIDALQGCGVEVTVLPALEDYPDSCFIGDTAVAADNGIVLCNPASAARRDEVAETEAAIRAFFPDERIFRIEDPGAMEGGDVVCVGKHFYVGEGKRTNGEGVMQFGHILRNLGLSCSGIRLQETPYLKAGVNYLGEGSMAISGELAQAVDFIQYFRLNAPEGEGLATNCLSVNGTVIVPDGAPQMEALLRENGYTVIILDMSEFQKIDGGLADLCILFDRP